MWESLLDSTRYNLNRLIGLEHLATPDPERVTCFKGRQFGFGYL